jgi:hypothetical protein
MLQEIDLRQKINDLTSFHKSYKRAYDWVCRKADADETFSASFKKLAVHFAEAKVRYGSSIEEQTGDLDDTSMSSDANGEFMRDENVEFTELMGFFEDLKGHCGGVILYSWRDDFKEISKQPFKLPFADSITNHPQRSE